MNKEFHPFVSIVIPVYNGSNYMREAIDSALAQTYDNIEIIVVNDGSKDNTEEIAKSYGDKIRYFPKENGGVSTALNMGIANMRGDYFSWLSHDDMYKPDKIEKNVAALKNDPMCIVYSDYECMDERQEYIGTVSSKRLHRAGNYEFGLFPLICGLVHGCSLLIHRTYFETYGVFDENQRSTQDYDLWFKMFRGQRLKYIPESLVKGRVHSKQTGRNYDKTILENEILWTYMLQSLTGEEMRAIKGSKRHFWINQAQFLKIETPFVKTAEYAFERLKESTDELRGGLVSVIIPFYNRVDLLLRSIKSVQKQSYQNWELILVNDGSTEDISEAEHYIAQNDRIKLISYDRNMGVAHARNTGLDAVTGAFIAFLDSDDTWEPMKLEKQIKYMLENNCCASHTGYYRVDAEGKLLNKFDSSQTQGDVFGHCLYSCDIATPCVVIDRELWGNLRFPQNMDYGEDVCVWLELAWIAKWGYIPEVLTSVYVKETSAYNDKRKQQVGYAEILRYVLKKPEWAAYQHEISIMALDFANLFTKPEIVDSHESAAPSGSVEEEASSEQNNLPIISNLQISSDDLKGSRFNGHNLHIYLREQGLDSKQLVMYKESNDENTFEFHFNEPGAVKEFLQKRIFTDADLIHFHLLHGKFDVNYLPLISNLKPTILTLHDLFFLGGHCVAHGDCEKWKTHCADCQYLTEIFAIDRDISALNFSMTKAAIQSSQISAIVASRWMKRKVESSPIWQGKAVYHLPFGIDQKIYKPGDIIAARKRHNIPENDTVLMFRNSSWRLKGRDIIIKALLSLPTTENITLITVDGRYPIEELDGKINIIGFEWIDDDELMADLFQACDMFLMPSRQDTFGLMAIEAMSCGKMVLAIEGNATAVPEVINAPSCGIAVNESEYAEELSRLIANKHEVLKRGQKSLDYAREFYSKDAYVQGMIRIYREVMSNHKFTPEMDLVLQQLKKYASEYTFNYAPVPVSPVTTNDSELQSLPPAAEQSINGIDSNILSAQESPEKTNDSELQSLPPAEEQSINGFDSNILLKPAKRRIFRRVVVKSARIFFRVIKKSTEALRIKKILKKTGLYRKLHAKGIMDKLNL